mmetsp:Transcript_60087/g.135539  ORF Transcript_60087/g.135539 Transcript_60087/m.135539 type:complete len:272 (+) Transcript_60087:38-853(+)
MSPSFAMVCPALMFTVWLEPGLVTFPEHLEVPRPGVVKIGVVPSHLCWGALPPLDDKKRLESILLSGGKSLSGTKEKLHSTSDEKVPLRQLTIHKIVASQDTSDLHLGPPRHQVRYHPMPVVTCIQIHEIDGLRGDLASGGVGPRAHYSCALLRLAPLLGVLVKYLHTSLIHIGNVNVVKRWDMGPRVNQDQLGPLPGAEKIHSILPRLYPDLHSNPRQVHAIQEGGKLIARSGIQRLQASLTILLGLRVFAGGHHCRRHYPSHDRSPQGC